jgi:hypothetical protein
MKRLPLIICLVLALGCAHYSTVRWSEDERLINAPIDVVWEKVLEILPTERITLRAVNKDEYFISAKKHLTFWSWSDDISIRLIPRGERQTIMNFDAGTVFGWQHDFGHEGRMVRNIFNRIKRLSEGI